MTPDAASIRAWTPDAHVEPSVRVGVILDQDARRTVYLRSPAEPYVVTVKQVSGQNGRRDLLRLGPHTPLEATHTGAALSIRIGAGAAQTCTSLRLSSAAQSRNSMNPRPLRPAAGVLVRNVVAGRGFHWEKPIDQTLPGTIELRPGRCGLVLVNELPLEDYLAGVITAEMSSACPAEFLKAQCVVARSWLLAMTESKHGGDPFDRCNDDCCQRYQGTGDLSETARVAVQATRGLVLLNPAGGVLDANYAKSCGGISETPRTVWGVDKPGLAAIVDAPVDADERRFFPITEANLDEYLDGDWLKRTGLYCSPNVVPVDAIGRYLGRVDQPDNYFRWTVRYERGALEQLLVEKLPEARALAVLRDLRVLSRGVSGRASALELEWEAADGQIVRARLDSEYRIRAVLYRQFLYSSAFAIRLERDTAGRLTTITLRGAGWGHGVGLCQIGALGMALSGLDFPALCRHYYPAARLGKVY